MRRWAELLAQIGRVSPFDYRYMREGRHRPDPLPELIAAHRAALAQIRADDVDAPVVLAGKSMGGRIGCHVSVEEPVTGLICFGYPLCGGGDTTKLRDKVLRDLSRRKKDVFKPPARSHIRKRHDVLANEYDC